MTNFEKYKDYLMKIDGEFAFNKNTREILSCSSCINCDDCIFNERNCAESDKIKWLCKEYEEPILSDDELELIKAISKATNKEYKYLAKQEGKIYLFTDKPFVHCSAFGNSYTSNRYFAYISDKDETLFQNIENESGIYDIENKTFTK
ncbi:MAG: hypothetical protein II669_03405 [Elusimicrobia bacterium]|nr:hypothetical protein [Elusimicrobiota bacterium]